MPQKQKQSTEEKIRIVQSYLRGEISISGAAETAGVSRATFRNWIRNYEADGADAFLPHNVFGKMKVVQKVPKM